MKNEYSKFQNKILKYYRKNGRHNLPWRETRDPYKIFLSEVMLQQTQVPRVIEKYKDFLILFPSLQILANAPQATVIKAWQGLGYNRRALFLKNSAKIIVTKHQGQVPHTHEDLLALPGIGPNTAGSLMAFIYNKPVIFIETNIRRVFLHEFFSDKQNISDKDIFPLIDKTLDNNNPREWYYALMDYGAHLAKGENANKRSKHYVKQSPLKGSRREIRGLILKLLSEKNEIKIQEIKNSITTPHSIDEVIIKMKKEGFITIEKDIIRL